MLFFAALALALHSPGLLIMSTYVAVLFYAHVPGRGERLDRPPRAARYQRYLARTGMFLPPQATNSPQLNRPTGRRWLIRQKFTGL